MSNSKAPKIKKIPLRKCVGCNGQFAKGDLIRVVRSPENEISLDFTGKKSGRGAYICKSTACFKKARRANRFKVNLDAEIPNEVLDALEKEISLIENEG